MEIKVERLSPELIESFLHFFDHVAFTDNEHWASCYCMFYRHNWGEGEWDSRSAEDNRRDSVKGIESAGLNGYLAFLDGQPVGWCHANRKDNVTKSPDPHAPDAAETGVFACFLVAPEHRGKGIASKLLEAASEGFREQGFTKIEAFPRREGVTVQDQYHGPLKMYLDHGFEVAREDADGFMMVQKTL